MARWSWPAFLLFVAPVALLVVNIVWGYGGILVLILLLVWLGVVVVLALPEETT